MELNCSLVDQKFFSMFLRVSKLLIVTANASHHNLSVALRAPITLSNAKST